MTTERDNSAERANVIIIYNQKDARWLKRLRVHLSPLERNGLINIWDYTIIEPGSQWRDEICHALNEAAIIVLLISADYLASDLANDLEIGTILLRTSRSYTLRILPILVGPCLYDKSPLSKFPAVNSTAGSLNSLSAAKQEQVLGQTARVVLDCVASSMNVPLSRSLNLDTETVVTAIASSQGVVPNKNGLDLVRKEISTIYSTAESTSARLAFLQQRPRRGRIVASSRLAAIAVCSLIAFGMLIISSEHQFQPDQQSPHQSRHLPPVRTSSNSLLPKSYESLIQRPDEQAHQSWNQALVQGNASNANNDLLNIDRFVTRPLSVLVGLATDAIGRANGDHSDLPRVLFAPCKDVHMTNGLFICLQSPREALIIWVKDQNCDDVQITENGKEFLSSPKLVAEGCQYRIMERDGVPVSTFSVGSRRNNQQWLTIVIDRSRPDPLQLTNIILKNAEAEFEKTMQFLWQKCNFDNSISTKIDCLYASATAKRRLGGEKNLRLAVDEYLTAIQLAAQAGLNAITFRLHYRLAGIFRENWQLDEAERLLRDAERFMTKGYGNDWILLASERGYLLHAAGRHAEAVIWLEEAYLTARRLGNCEMQRRVAPILADSLMSTGKITEASAQLGFAQQCLDGLDRCTQAAELSSMGWLALRYAEEHIRPRSLPSIGTMSINGTFLQALEHGIRCGNSMSLANIYTGLAETSLRENRVGESRRWIKKAREERGMWAADKFELLNIEGRLALRENKLNIALRLFNLLNQKLTEMENKNFQKDFSCYASVGTLEALALLGNHIKTASELKLPCLDMNNKSMLSLTEIKRLTARMKIASRSKAAHELSMIWGR